MPDRRVLTTLDRARIGADCKAYGGCTVRCGFEWRPFVPIIEHYGADRSARVYRLTLSMPYVDREQYLRDAFARDHLEWRESDQRELA